MGRDWGHCDGRIEPSGASRSLCARVAEDLPLGQQRTARMSAKAAIPVAFPRPVTGIVHLLGWMGVSWRNLRAGRTLLVWTCERTRPMRREGFNVRLAAPSELNHAAAWTIR